jgi:glycosyltransferase involved in cell wall biosynthesis
MHICLITSGRPFEPFPSGEGKFTLSFRDWIIEHNLTVTIVGRKLFGVKVVESNDSQEVESGTQLTRPSALPLPYPMFILCMLMTSLLFVLRILTVNRRSRISIIHAQDTGYGGLAAVVSAKILKVPVVLSSHGIRHVTIYNALKGVSRSLSYPFERWLDVVTSTNADSIIVLASSQKTVFASLGVKTSSIRMIPTCINVSSFSVPRGVRQSVREELGVSNNVVIGFVGRFFAEKNLFTLLGSFARASETAGETKLVLVGTGPLEKQLRMFCHQLSINDKVVFTGFRKDVNRLLSALDVFVLPSYTEGCPTALLEAMASGKAIISSNIPSIREIVRHSKEAILVNPYDAEELKQAILLLYNNSSLRAELGHNAAKRVTAYNIDEVCGQVQELYKELIHSKD